MRVLQYIIKEKDSNLLAFSSNNQFYRTDYKLYEIPRNRKREINHSYFNKTHHSLLPIPDIIIL